MSERRFPIQKDRIEYPPHIDRMPTKIPATTVPWSEAEIAYRTYTALFGSQQSLETLAERGGFGRFEFAMLRAGLCPLDRRPRLDVPLVTEAPVPSDPMSLEPVVRAISDLAIRRTAYEQDGVSTTMHEESIRAELAPSDWGPIW